MRVRLAVACTCSLLLSLIVGLSATAQDVQVYPDVFRDVKHDVSPPLRAVRPLLASNGQRVIPLRPVTPHVQRQAPPDPVLQLTPGPAVSATAGLNFDGVSANGYAPPDTNGAVGATQYVQWVNVKLAVFDKSSGNLVLGPVAGNSIWSGFGGACESSNDGDPIAQYDKIAGRWVMAQPVFSSPYMYCIAISQTSDATGSWYRYAFPMPNFPDYPKLSVWPDAYYASFNLFNGNFFQGAYACAFDRDAMLTGAAATEQCFTTSSSYGSLLPSDLDGKTQPTGEPAFFLNFGSNSLNLWRFHVDWTNSSLTTFTGPINIPVAGFSQACGGGVCIAQPGTKTKLDSLGDRLMYRLAYRKFSDHESLYVNHSITAGSSVGVRWYEIRSPNGTPSVYQQGTFAPDSKYRWMGSIAADQSGDIAAGYSVSSSGTYPSIYYTGRQPSDPLGTLGSETLIKTGSGSQTNNLTRWGDYSAMSVDPVDDCTFWYTNEYLPSSGSFNWNTRIASFKFANCGGSATPDFTIGATPTSQTVTAGNSTTYSVTISALNSYGGTVGFNVSGLPPGSNYNFSPSTVTGSGTSQLTVDTSSSDAPGTFTLTITGTDQSDSSLTHSTQVTLVVQSASGGGDFGVSSSSFTVYRNATGSTPITVTPSGGFTGSVSLSVSGIPKRTSSSISPNPVTISGSSVNSTLTVKVNRNATTGPYPLTITGTSGSVSHQTNITLTIN